MFVRGERLIVVRCLRNIVHLCFPTFYTMGFLGLLTKR